MEVRGQAIETGSLLFRFLLKDQTLAPLIPYPRPLADITGFKRPSKMQTPDSGGCAEPDLVLITGKKLPDKLW